MPMTEPEFKLLAIDLLRQLGVDAKPVPEASESTPDLRGTDGTANYAIELKQRDGDRFFDEMIQPLAVGQAVELEPLGLDRERATRKAINKAASQLKREADGTLRIVWIHCEGFDAESDYDRSIASLMGTATLIDRSHVRGDESNAYRCHFFGHSDFWTYRNVLDGGIVSRDKGGDDFEVCLLVNPHSQQVDGLRACAIAANLSDGVVDVAELEAAGECLWADTELDRNDAQKIMEHLNEKYGMDLMPFTVHRYGVAIRAK